MAAVHPVEALVDMHLVVKTSVNLLFSKLAIFAAVIHFSGVNYVEAHGGGLDSSGGHNCYVGSCAGTYHYHGAKSQGDFPIGLLLFCVFIAFSGYVVFNKGSHNTKRQSFFWEENLQHEPFNNRDHDSINYHEKELLLIHGPELIELERFSGSSGVREQSLELIKSSLAMKQNPINGASYYKTKNKVEKSTKYPYLHLRESIELFIVKLDGVLVSIERTRNGFSDGFLHPKLVIERGGKLYEVDSDGEWQLASELYEISFVEFSESWQLRSLKYQNSRWDRWYAEFLKDQ